MREDYSTVSIKSEDNVEPLPDEPKLTERSDDYVIFPKEELHLKAAERSRTGKWTMFGITGTRINLRSKYKNERLLAHSA